MMWTNKLAYLMILTTLACGVHRAPQTEINEPYALPNDRPDEAFERLLVNRVEHNPENAEAHRDLGSLYQSQTTMVEGDERVELIRRANQHLEKAFAAMPDDPQTLIYLGLSRASLGKDPDLSWPARIQNAFSGFSLMDRAVSLQPNNFSLRVIRAKAGTLAPPIMGRGATLEEDYQFVKGLVEGGTLPIHLETIGLIFLGDYHYKRNPELAKSYWQQALTKPSSFTIEATWRLDGTYKGF